MDYEKTKITATLLWLCATFSLLTSCFFPNSRLGVALLFVAYAFLSAAYFTLRFAPKRKNTLKSGLSLNTSKV